MLSNLVAQPSGGADTNTSEGLSELSPPEFDCSRGGGAVAKLNAVALIVLLGWHATDQGKGGHTVYKHPDSEHIITIPSSKELSREVQRTTAATLGMSITDFREAARSPKKWVKRQAA